MSNENVEKVEKAKGVDGEELLDEEMDVTNGTEGENNKVSPPKTDPNPLPVKDKSRSRSRSPNRNSAPPHSSGNTYGTGNVTQDK